MMLKINGERLLGRITAFGKIGAMEKGGVCRLALTDEDKQARDLLKNQMRDLGLQIKIDGIGNMFGTRKGKYDQPPVCFGSHLDTVGTGGLYDGSLGVLAAMEVIERINELKIETEKPITVINFTNEEGVRFTPDMMGSFFLQGGMPLEDLLSTRSVDDSVVLGNELKRIGYDGKEPRQNFKASAFIELHIEQGPVLEQDTIQIGAVEMVQGISWTEFIIKGQASHAGTTPISMRKDAGFVAGEVISFIRKLTSEIGANQVATAGLLEVEPNLINVVPEKVRMTVDLRNTEEEKLQEAERKLEVFVKKISEKEKVEVETNKLVRFKPVDFNADIISLIEGTSKENGYSVKRMPSGAGHDAQMMANICPTAMIFIPSVDGISHNIHEYSKPEDIEAGANVLLNTVLKLATIS